MDQQCASNLCAYTSDPHRFDQYEYDVTSLSAIDCQFVSDHHSSLAADKYYDDHWTSAPCVDQSLCSSDKSTSSLPSPVANKKK